PSQRLPPDLVRDVTAVHREAERAARIVSNLLLFAGSGRLRARTVSLNAVVARVLKLRARALKSAGIVVARDFAESSPLIKADPLLLQQAILNVVINAEQAMDGDGHLLIRTSVDVASGRAVVVIVD